MGVTFHKSSMRSLLILSVVMIAVTPSQCFSSSPDTIRYVTRSENIQESNLIEDLSHDYPAKSELFKDTNAISRSITLPEREFLQAILPKPMNVLEHLFATCDRQVGVDVTVEYPFTNTEKGAKELVIKCLAASKSNLSRKNLDKYSYSISEYLKTFRNVFASDDKSITSKTLAKARIVSSRGDLGQKCPRWHIDHVPVRLVSSLVGPGCVYVPFENELRFPGCIDRDALNSLDLESSDEANSFIFPHYNSQAAIAANAGDVVLLMGRSWEQIDSAIKAVPHKSPKLSDGEPRILLTVDIIPER